MKFMDDNVLLESETARRLYAACKDLPIIDYHSHLSPKEIADNRAFANLTELWLGGDHYKWRLMRACGTDERLITGDEVPADKFRAFAAAVEQAPGNPVTVWCQFELKAYFGITEPLTAASADRIYAQTAAQMAQGGFGARDLILRSGVQAVCTTDDPADDLMYHRALADSGFACKVLPSFRPDKALNIDKPGFTDYVRALGANSYADLKRILLERLDFFVKTGCRVTDSALDGYVYAPITDGAAERIFAAALSGNTVSPADAEGYRTALLLFLARAYHERGLAMQLHFCCQRNINGGMYGRLGPDTGFDAIDVSPDVRKLAFLLDALGDDLPRTVVYSLNPNDDRIIDSIIGAFQRGRGYVQHGSAWWFNDTYRGIRAHLSALCEYGAIGTFVGMLTDSRSFSSYVRHDYFRRILCGVIAEEVDRGLFPLSSAQTVVRNVSYYNVKTLLKE